MPDSAWMVDGGQDKGLDPFLEKLEQLLKFCNRLGPPEVHLKGQHLGGANRLSTQLRQLALGLLPVRSGDAFDVNDHHIGR